MMSLTTEELGKRLLAEVEERGNLSEILQHLWTDPQRQSASRLGIPALDRIIALFRQHAPPSVQQRPPVLELVSNTPGAGKTHLLYLLTAAAVLREPPSARDHAADGAREPGTAVIIDADNRFDVQRLAEVMMHYQASQLPNPAQAGFIEQSTIQSGAEGTVENMVSSEVQQALRHIHILRPQSLISLINTAKHLESYLSDLTQHHSANGHLALLAIDSMTAFYWPDRSEREIASLESHGPNVEPSPYADLVAELKQLQLKFRCPVVATAWSLSGTVIKDTVTGPGINQMSSLRPLLPGVWTQYVDVRLAVSRVATKRFPAGLTSVEAERDRKPRQEVVERNRFRVEIDHWGADTWTEVIAETLRRQSRMRGFGLVVSNRGVLVDG